MLASHSGLTSHPIPWAGRGCPKRAAPSAQAAFPCQRREGRRYAFSTVLTETRAELLLSSRQGTEQRGSSACPKQTQNKTPINHKVRLAAHTSHLGFESAQMLYQRQELAFPLRNRQGDPQQPATCQPAAAVAPTLLPCSADLPHVRADRAESSCRQP